MFRRYFLKRQSFNIISKTLLLSITKSLYIQVFKIYHTYIELERIGTKLEGETCGACFNPAVDFDCGQCVEGLECVSHPDVELIPDLPATCKAPLGNKELNIKIYPDACLYNEIH